MFFRRKETKILSLTERFEEMRREGFQVESANGLTRVSRGGYAALIEGTPQAPQVKQAGILLDGEIATLLSGGYQMFVQTPGGRRQAAQASQLKGLHAFQEDLKESLGLASLYNTSLGTTSSRHLYDRVNSRDRGVPKRPWE